MRDIKKYIKHLHCVSTQETQTSRAVFIYNNNEATFFVSRTHFPKVSGLPKGKKQVPLNHL